MKQNIHKMLNKLFEKRDSTENDSYKHHVLVLEFTENQSRSTKIKTAIINCETLMEPAVEKKKSFNWL